MSGVAPTPVTIVAGSFASGKTTLCNRWLDSLASSGHRIALFAHRFAEEYACQAYPINGAKCALLEEIYDYGSGCLCCTPGGELSDRLKNMVAWGETYDRVLVRTGPVADPSLFVAVINGSGNYCVEGIVTVVDAYSLVHLDISAEDSAKKQLQLADVVLLWAQEPELQLRAERILQSICPSATVLSESGLSTSECISFVNPGCREKWSELTTKMNLAPPPLIQFPGQHLSRIKAIQIVENGAVQAELARDWVTKQLQSGCCIRLKAIFPLRSEQEVAFLLVDATRGRSPNFSTAGCVPQQCKMGDLEVLVCTNTVDESITDPQDGRSISRIFTLVGPPRVAGLGDEHDMCDLVPSADDLADSFRTDVLAHAL